MNIGIVWFRTDLRLSDNLALKAALDNCDQIVPVYIFDEQWLTKDQWGFDRIGPFRMQFIVECLTDLKEHLKEVGSDLIIKRGRPEQIIPQVSEQYNASQVYCSKEYTFEEIKVEKAISKKMEVAFFHNSPMVHPEDVNFSIDRMPEVFSSFRKKVEKYSSIRKPFLSPKEIKSPSLEATAVPQLGDFGFSNTSMDDRAALKFKGGALEAWNRLEHYFWNTEHLSNYKETRNGLVGADYSSKFSPWLAQGCISARAIYDEVEKYEADVEQNKSTYWMNFELLWRDFFKYTAMRYGKRIFLPKGIKEHAKVRKYNPKTVQKWINGETGDDFVDANMQELKLTGFMSNRGRQNVASYLVHRLNQDWRVGAAWFESMLIDYDVTSNYGNWIYAAGVGNDPRDRVFNTKKQAEMYDKKSMYRDLWLKAKVD